MTKAIDEILCLIYSLPWFLGVAGVFLLALLGPIILIDQSTGNHLRTYLYPGVQW